MENKLDLRQQLILDYLAKNKLASIQDILNAVNERTKVSKITINRDLSYLQDLNLISQVGKARAVKYSLSEEYRILQPIDLKEYFSKSVDDRFGQKSFNFGIFELLKSAKLFSEDQLNKLNTLHESYKANVKNLSPTILKKEFERVTIELSWKSSVIEGNTYSLLETESLLKDGIEAKGKTKEEAIMLLNHKAALNFVRENISEFRELSVAKIEAIHALLIKNLNVSRNIRKTLVGITGTNYKPLDNEFQIREALENMCELINSFNNHFLKTMLTMLLISYIQPFEDGNKRTSRIIGNAVLLSYDSFPLPLRSIDEGEYKQAILTFYELNNLFHFRRLFIEQAEFSVNNYFRVSTI